MDWQYWNERTSGCKTGFSTEGKVNPPLYPWDKGGGGLGFGDLPVYYQVLAETSSDSPGSLELLPAGALRGALKPYIALSCWKLLWCLFFSCGDGQNHLCWVCSFHRPKLRPRLVKKLSQVWSRRESLPLFPHRLAPLVSTPWGRIWLP